MNLDTLLGVPSDPAAEQEKPVPSTFGWATVTATLPLQVRKDGEGDPLPMVPEVVGVGPFAYGTRVWCQFFGLRVLILGRVPDVWHPFPFASGWTNYGSGFQLCEYTMAGGEVRLHGLVKGGAGLIGTLPPGYTPAASEVFSATAPSNGSGDVRISSTGAVTLNTVSTTTGYLSLSKIAFTPPA